MAVANTSDSRSAAVRAARSPAILERLQKAAHIQAQGVQLVLGGLFGEEQGPQVDGNAQRLGQERCDGGPL